MTESSVTPLRRVREARKLTLQQVSAQTGINTGNLSRIERGGSTSPERAELLARLFAPDITELEILYPERFMPPSDEEGACASQ